MLKKKKSTYALIVIIILLPLVFKPYREYCYKLSADFFYPFLSAPIAVKNTINEKSLFFANKQDLISRMLELQKKNIEVEARCKYLENLKEENDKLKNFLNIKPLPQYRYLYAEVSFRDPSKWYQQFVINEGEADGIRNGSIVLAQCKKNEEGKVQFAVVGRIGLLSKHTAVVYTLLSDECQLSVTIPANGSNGIIKGGERSGSNLWADITYLPKDLDYVSGSMVVTSGLSAFAPRGLTIGSLDTQRSDNAISRGLYENVRVKLAADLNHLGFVLVLVE